MPENGHVRCHDTNNVDKACAEQVTPSGETFDASTYLARIHQVS